MSKYVRNAQAVLPKLVVNEGGQVITKANCKIQVPVRFSEIGLGQIGIDTFAYGLFPIIMEDGNYALMNVTALVELDPFKLEIIEIDDVQYHEFSFEAGQVVIKTTNLLQKETLMYNILDELIFKGKIPWYVAYEDLGKIFDSAKKHAKSNVGNIPETIEFIAAMVCRSKEDRTKYIRTVANTYKDTSLSQISYVPLKSVFYAVNSTVNKLTGSYFSDGIVSALVNPTTKVEKIESILRA
jgi:hypothetical protein